MKIITEITVPVNIRKPVVTIGTFDGVHLGHRVILEEVKRLAALTGGDSAVVTFNPHPRIVLGQDVLLLNTREEKRQVIESLGITHLVEIPFTVRFSDLEANEFISLLAWLLNPAYIIIGYDHGFGRNRSGDIAQLEAAGRVHGFKVVNVEAIEKEGSKISSSIIRTLLLEGRVQEAGELLGQPYSLSGTVIRGNQIGKRLGYPTANLYLEDTHKLIPAMGVYASKVIYNNRVYKGMTNIGIRPTINTHQLTIETNIFEFDQDIYYEKITVEMIARIRDEKKFDSLDVLKEQLRQDKEDSLRILEG